MDADELICRSFKQEFRKQIVLYADNVDGQLFSYGAALSVFAKCLNNKPKSEQIIRTWDELMRSVVQSLLNPSQQPSEAALRKFDAMLQPWLVNESVISEIRENIQVLHHLAENGAWSSPPLQALLKEEEVDQTALGEVLDKENPMVVVVRLQILNLDTQQKSVWSLIDCALSKEKYKTNKMFQKAFQTHAVYYKGEKDLLPLCEQFDFKATLEVIDKFKMDEQLQKMTFLCDTVLTYMWKTDTVTMATEMTSKWCEINLAETKDTAEFASLVKERLATAKGPTTVTHCLILMQTIWETVGESCRILCVDILMRALYLLRKEEDTDNQNKIRILETIARLLPNSMVARLCTISVFILEPCIETYFLVAEAFKKTPDEEQEQQRVELKTELTLYISDQFPSGTQPELSDWSSLKEECLSKLSPDDIRLVQLEETRKSPQDATLSDATGSTSSSSMEAVSPVVEPTTDDKKCQTCSEDQVCAPCKKKEEGTQKKKKKAKKKRFGWTCPVVSCKVISGRMYYLCNHLRTKHGWDQEEISAFTKSLGVTKHAVWTAGNDNFVPLSEGDTAGLTEDDKSLSPNSVEEPTAEASVSLPDKDQPEKVESLIENLPPGSEDPPAQNIPEETDKQAKMQDVETAGGAESQTAVSSNLGADHQCAASSLQCEKPDNAWSPPASEESGGWNSMHDGKTELHDSDPLPQKEQLEAAPPQEIKTSSESLATDCGPPELPPDPPLVKEAKSDDVSTDQRTSLKVYLHGRRKSDERETKSKHEHHMSNKSAGSVSENSHSESKEKHKKKSHHSEKKRKEHKHKKKDHKDANSVSTHSSKSSKAKSTPSSKKKLEKTISLTKGKSEIMPPPLKEQTKKTSTKHGENSSTFSQTKPTKPTAVQQSNVGSEDTVMVTQPPRPEKLPSESVHVMPVKKSSVPITNPVYSSANTTVNLKTSPELPPAHAPVDKRHPGYVCPSAGCGRIFIHKHTIIAHLKFRHHIGQSDAERLSENAKEAIKEEPVEVEEPEPILPLPTPVVNKMICSRGWYLKVDTYIHESEDEEKVFPPIGKPGIRNCLVDCLHRLFHTPLTNFNYNSASKYISSSWPSLAHSSPEARAEEEFADIFEPMVIRMPKKSLNRKSSPAPRRRPSKEGRKSSSPERPSTPINDEPAEEESGPESEAVKNYTSVERSHKGIQTQPQGVTMSGRDYEIVSNYHPKVKKVFFERARHNPSPTVMTGLAFGKTPTRTIAVQAKTGPSGLKPESPKLPRPAYRVPSIKNTESTNSKKEKFKKPKPLSISAPPPRVDNPGALATSKKSTEKIKKIQTRDPAVATVEGQQKVAPKNPAKSMSFEEALTDPDRPKAEAENHKAKPYQKAVPEMEKRLSIAPKAETKQKRSVSLDSGELSDRSKVRKFSQSSEHTAAGNRDRHGLHAEKKKHKKSHRKHSAEVKEPAERQEESLLPVEDYQHLLKRAEEVSNNRTVNAPTTSKKTKSENEAHLSQSSSVTNRHKAKPAEGKRDGVPPKKTRVKPKRSIDLRKLSSVSQEDENSNIMPKRTPSADRANAQSERNNPLGKMLSAVESDSSSGLDCANASNQDVSGVHKCHICGKNMTSGFALTCHMRKKHKVKTKMFIPDDDTTAPSGGDVDRERGHKPKKRRHSSVSDDPHANSKQQQKPPKTEKVKVAKNDEPVHAGEVNKDATCAQAETTTTEAGHPSDKQPTDDKSRDEFFKIFYSPSYRKLVSATPKHFFTKNWEKTVYQELFRANKRFNCPFPSCKASLSNKKGLKRHVIMVHHFRMATLMQHTADILSTDSIRKCLKCHEVFGDFVTLEKHIEQNIKCRVIPELKKPRYHVIDAGKTDSEIYGDVKVATQLGITCFTCKKEGFSSIRSVQDHLRKIHGKSVKQLNVTGEMDIIKSEAIAAFRRLSVESSRADEQYDADSEEVKETLSPRINAHDVTDDDATMASDTAEVTEGCGKGIPSDDKPGADETSPNDAGEVVEETQEELEQGKENSEQDRISENPQQQQSWEDEHSHESDSSSCFEDSQDDIIAPEEDEVFKGHNVQEEPAAEVVENLPETPGFLTEKEQSSCTEDELACQEADPTEDTDIPNDSFSSQEESTCKSPVTGATHLRRLAYTQAARKIAMKTPEDFNRKRWSEFQNLSYLYNKRALKRVALALSPAPKMEKGESIPSATAPKHAPASDSSGENLPKKCWLCKDTFLRQSNYVSHIVHHLRSIDRYENRCDFPGCLYGFRTAEQLNVHQLLHNDGVYVCLFCSDVTEPLTTCRDLLRHEREQHSAVHAILPRLRNEFCINAFPKVERQLHRVAVDVTNDSDSGAYCSSDHSNTEHFLGCSHRKRNRTRPDDQLCRCQDEDDASDDLNTHCSCEKSTAYCDNTHLCRFEENLQRNVCDIMTDILDTIEEADALYVSPSPVEKPAKITLSPVKIRLSRCDDLVSSGTSTHRISLTLQGESLDDWTTIISDRLSVGKDEVSGNAGEQHLELTTEEKNAAGAAENKRSTDCDRRYVDIKNRGIDYDLPDIVLTPLSKISCSVPEPGDDPTSEEEDYEEDPDVPDDSDNDRPYVPDSDDASSCSEDDSVKVVPKPCKPELRPTPPLLKYTTDNSVKKDSEIAQKACKQGLRPTVLRREYTTNDFVKKDLAVAQKACRQELRPTVQLLGFTPDYSVEKCLEIARKARKQEFRQNVQLLEYTPTDSVKKDLEIVRKTCRQELRPTVQVLEYTTNDSAKKDLEIARKACDQGLGPTVQLLEHNTDHSVKKDSETAQKVCHPQLRPTVQFLNYATECANVDPDVWYDLQEGQPVEEIVVSAKCSEPPVKHHLDVPDESTVAALTNDIRLDSTPCQDEAADAVLTDDTTLDQCVSVATAAVVESCNNLTSTDCVSVTTKPAVTSFSNLTSSECDTVTINPAVVSIGSPTTSESVASVCNLTTSECVSMTTKSAVASTSNLTADECIHPTTEPADYVMTNECVPTVAVSPIVRWDNLSAYGCVSMTTESADDLNTEGVDGPIKPCMAVATLDHSPVETPSEAENIPSSVLIPYEDCFPNILDLLQPLFQTGYSLDEDDLMIIDAAITLEYIVTAVESMEQCDRFSEIGINEFSGIFTVDDQHYQGVKCCVVVDGTALSSATPGAGCPATSVTAGHDHMLQSHTTLTVIEDDSQEVKTTQECQKDIICEEIRETGLEETLPLEHNSLSLVKLCDQNSTGKSSDSEYAFCFSPLFPAQEQFMAIPRIDDNLSLEIRINRDVAGFTHGGISVPAIEWKVETPQIEIAPAPRKIPPTDQTPTPIERATEIEPCFIQLEETSKSLEASASNEFACVKTIPVKQAYKSIFKQAKRKSCNASEDLFMDGVYAAIRRSSKKSRSGKSKKIKLESVIRDPFRKFRGRMSKHVQDMTCTELPEEWHQDESIFLKMFPSMANLETGGKKTKKATSRPRRKVKRSKSLDMAGDAIGGFPFSMISPPSAAFLLKSPMKNQPDAALVPRLEKLQPLDIQARLSQRQRSTSESTARPPTYVRIGASESTARPPTFARIGADITLTPTDWGTDHGFLASVAKKAKKRALADRGGGIVKRQKPAQVSSAITVQNMQMTVCGYAPTKVRPKVQLKQQRAVKVWPNSYKIPKISVRRENSERNLVQISPSLLQELITCGTCLKEVVAKDLLEHMLNHALHSENVYKCNTQGHLCFFECRTEKELILHSKRHTGQKPFLCMFCPDVFGNHYEVEAHRAQKHRLFRDLFHKELTARRRNIMSILTKRFIPPLAPIVSRASTERSSVIKHTNRTPEARKGVNMTEAPPNHNQSMPGHSGSSAMRAVAIHGIPLSPVTLLSQFVDSNSPTTCKYPQASGDRGNSSKLVDAVSVCVKAASNETENPGEVIVIDLGSENAHARELNQPPPIPKPVTKPEENRKNPEIGSSVKQPFPVSKVVPVPDENWKNLEIGSSVRQPLAVSKVVTTPDENWKNPEKSSSVRQSLPVSQVVTIPDANWKNPKIGSNRDSAANSQNKKTVHADLESNTIMVPLEQSHSLTQLQVCAGGVQPSYSLKVTPEKSGPSRNVNLAAFASKPVKATKRNEAEVSVLEHETPNECSSDNEGTEAEEPIPAGEDATAYHTPKRSQYPDIARDGCEELQALADVCLSASRIPHSEIDGHSKTITTLKEQVRTKYPALDSVFPENMKDKPANQLAQSINSSNTGSSKWVEEKHNSAPPTAPVVSPPRSKCYNKIKVKASVFRSNCDVEKLRCDVATDSHATMTHVSDKVTPAKIRHIKRGGINTSATKPSGSVTDCHIPSTGAACVVGSCATKHAYPVVPRIEMSSCHVGEIPVSGSEKREDTVTSTEDNNAPGGAVRHGTLIMPYGTIARPTNTGHRSHELDKVDAHAIRQAEEITSVHQTTTIADSTQDGSHVVEHGNVVVPSSTADTPCPRKTLDSIEECDADNAEEVIKSDSGMKTHGDISGTATFDGTVTSEDGTLAGSAVKCSESGKSEDSSLYRDHDVEPKLPEDITVTPGTEISEPLSLENPANITQAGTHNPALPFPNFQVAWSSVANPIYTSSRSFSQMHLSSSFKKSPERVPHRLTENNTLPTSAADMALGQIVAETEPGMKMTAGPEWGASTCIGDRHKPQVPVMLESTGAPRIAFRIPIAIGANIHSMENRSDASHFPPFLIVNSEKRSEAPRQSPVLVTPPPSTLYSGSPVPPSQNIMRTFPFSAASGMAHSMPSAKSMMGNVTCEDTNTIHFSRSALLGHTHLQPGYILASRAPISTKNLTYPTHATIQSNSCYQRTPSAGPSVALLGHLSHQPVIPPRNVRVVETRPFHHTLPYSRTEHAYVKRACQKPVIPFMMPTASMESPSFIDRAVFSAGLPRATPAANQNVPMLVTVPTATLSSGPTRKIYRISHPVTRKVQIVRPVMRSPAVDHEVKALAQNASQGRVLSHSVQPIVQIPGETNTPASTSQDGSASTTSVSLRHTRIEDLNFMPVQSYSPDGGRRPQATESPTQQSAAESNGTQPVVQASSTSCQPVSASGHLGRVSTMSPAGPGDKYKIDISTSPIRCELLPTGSGAGTSSTNDSAPHRQSNGAILDDENSIVSILVEEEGQDSSNQSLGDEIASSNEDESYPCDFCEMAFRGEEELQEHRVEEHMEMRCYYPGCTASCRTLEELNRHLRMTAHPNTATTDTQTGHAPAKENKYMSEDLREAVWESDSSFARKYRGQLQPKYMTVGDTVDRADVAIEVFQDLKAYSLKAKCASSKKPGAFVGEAVACHIHQCSFASPSRECFYRHYFTYHSVPQILGFLRSRYKKMICDRRRKSSGPKKRSVKRESKSNEPTTKRCRFKGCSQVFRQPRSASKKLASDFRQHMLGHMKESCCDVVPLGKTFVPIFESCVQLSPLIRPKIALSGRRMDPSADDSCEIGVDENDNLPSFSGYSSGDSMDSFILNNPVPTSETPTFHPILIQDEILPETPKTSTWVTSCRVELSHADEMPVSALRRTETDPGPSLAELACRNSRGVAGETLNKTRHLSLNEHTPKVPLVMLEKLDCGVN